MAFDGSVNIDSSIDGSGFSKGLEKLGGIAKTSLGALTGAIGAAASALGGAAIAGVKYNSEMEQYITSFGTMLGGADKATALVANLKKFAADTPFEFSDLAKGTQTLLAFGTSAKDIMPDLQMLGDVSQGNKERFDALTLAFAQVGSAGKMQGQDLLQFVNAGFNPLTIMAQKSGKSMADLRDEMQKGQISAQDVADAFKTATSQGGQFFNAMQAQSKTFNGQMSTLKDNAMQFLGELTAGLQNSLKDTALPMVNDWMGQLQAAFASGGVNGVVQAFGGVLSQAVTAVAQQAPQIIQLGISLIQSLVQGISANSAALSTAVVSVITTLANGIITLLPQIIQTGGQLLLSIAQGLAQQLPQIITQAMMVIQTLVQSLTANLPAIVQTAFQIVLAIVEGLVQQLPSLIPAAVQCILTLVMALLNNIDKLIDAAIDLLIALADGLIQALPILIDKAPEIIEKLVAALIRNAPKIAAAAVELFLKLGAALGQIDWLSLGVQLIEGIVKGIWDGITHIDWGKIGNSLLGGLKSVLGIHSPSRLFRDEIGKMLPPGIAIGFEASMPDAISDMRAQMDAMTTKMQASVAAQQSAVFMGASGAGAQTVDNSVTKAPVININGPVNVTDQGNQRQTLQQLQFLASI